MQSWPHSFAAENHAMTRHNAAHKFAIAGSGQPSPWAAVRAVRAWITEGDGDWGFDEVYHLQIEYANGRKLHLTDAAPETASVFFDASNSLEHLLGLKIDWRGPILGEYQRYKSKPWWTKFLAGWRRPKLTVYASEG